MNIYGAGMAGLLAAIALRRFNPTIFEAQSELPNNHAALLRFRSDIASQATRIPFKRVQVNKLVSHAGKLYDKPNLKLSNMYSQKVTKKVMGRSINNLDPVTRYIAPPDFINQMASGVNIEYNKPLTREILRARAGQGAPEPIISTIPMNILMDMVDWPDKPEFEFATIWSVWGEFEEPVCDVYQTVYFPDYTDPYYRISITGKQFIAEYIEDPSTHYSEGSGSINDFPASHNMFEDLAAVIAREFGIHSFRMRGELEVKEQKYGKLIPIPERQRKEFIMYMTDKFGIYSLGRFATWRQLLLDDIVEDVEVIEDLIDHRDNYSRAIIGSKTRK